jgi:hypothetical protein
MPIAYPFSPLVLDISNKNVKNIWNIIPTIQRILIYNLNFLYLSKIKEKVTEDITPIKLENPKI